MSVEVASPIRSHPRHFTVGDWHVRPVEGVLERDGERRRLRPKAMDVLALLATRPRSTVLREEFFRQVWDDQLVDEASLAHCIAEVRAALGDDAQEPRYIETIPRRGYRLIAPVADGDRPGELLRHGNLLCPKGLGSAFGAGPGERDA